MALVPIDAALPPRRLDPRLTALHDRYGYSPIPLGEVSGLYGVSDDRFRLVRDFGIYRLQTVDPADVIIPIWVARYRPYLRRLSRTFTTRDFSRLTLVPFFTSNLILSHMLRDGTIDLMNQEVGAPLFRRKAKKVIWKRRIIWGS